MTCVIGTPKWICADRRITSDGERCPNERKLWSNHALVVAGAGRTAKLHAIRDMVAAGATDISRFREPLGDDAHVLVLKDGELWEVTDGSLWRHKGLRCIGTGGDLARGFLEGKPVTEQSARNAQKFVARMRDDCGGGCDFAGGLK